jgi:hypothetical protein
MAIKKLFTKSFYVFDYNKSLFNITKSMSSNNNTASISQWASIRLAVGAAMVITYSLYYAAQHYANFKQNERPKIFVQISDLGSKMYLYGIGCLLSLNFLQSGVFQVVFAYLTMLTIAFVLLVTIIESTGERLRVGSNIIFHLFIAIWYIGIIVDYFKNQSYN